MKRWAAIGLGTVLGMSAHGATVDEADIEQLVRLHDLQRATGVPMPLELGLCVEDTLGKRRLAAPNAPGGQRDQDRLRQARERCELQLRAFAQHPATGAPPEDFRLVSEVRTAFIARVARLRASEQALQACVAPARQASSPAECLTRALGRPASARELKTLGAQPRWLASPSPYGGIRPGDLAFVARRRRPPGQSRTVRS